MIDRLHRAIDRVPPWFATATAVGAFVAVASWLTISTWHGIKATRLDSGLLTDFRDAIYYPVVALRHGVNPYRVEEYYRRYPVGQEFPLYTPIHLLIHWPLSFLSFSTARAVAFAWNLTLVLGLAVAALRLAARRVTVAGVFGLATLLLVSDPGKFDLRTGQPTLMIVIALYWVWRTASMRNEVVVPFPATPFVLGVIGLAIVWSKPTFAIPVVVLLVVRGRVKVAVVGTALGAVLSAVLLPTLIDAAGGMNKLVESWRASADITSRSLQSRLGSGLRIDAANTFVRITRIRPSETVGALGGLVVLVAGAWIIGRLHRIDPSGDREELVLTLGCLVILTSMYHVPYDYLLLVGPMVMLLRPRPTREIPWPRRARVAVVVLLLLPLIDPLGWSPINSVLGKSGFQWLLGPTMLSSYVLSALALCVWTAFRVQRDPATVSPAPELVHP